MYTILQPEAGVVC